MHVRLILACLAVRTQAPTLHFHPATKGSGTQCSCHGPWGCESSVRDPSTLASTSLARAGDPLYNIFVDYVLLGDRSSGAHGLTSYQLKELLEDAHICDSGHVQYSSIWPTQSKAAHERVHDRRGAVAGGTKLQFVAWLEVLLEVSMRQGAELHASLFRVRSARSGFTYLAAYMQGTYPTSRD